MSLSLALVLLVVGILLLYMGGEGFVRGGVTLASHYRVEAYVVGATLIALGTSLPEAVTSFYAALRGATDISVANVVGSNMANIALILGAVALLAPVTVNRDVFSQDSPSFLMSAGLALILGLDGKYSRLDGLLLLSLIVAYVWFIVRDPAATLPESKPLGRLSTGWLMILVSPLILALGSKLTVDSAVYLAEQMGVSQWVIGVSMIAVGTSLPEISTSIVATLRGEQAIAVGNLLGSNIFNIYFILGGASIIRPMPVGPGTRAFDLPVLFIFHLVVLFMLYDKRLERDSGITLILGYAAFIIGVLTFH